VGPPLESLHAPPAVSQSQVARHRPNPSSSLGVDAAFFRPQKWGNQVLKPYKLWDYGINHIPQLVKNGRNSSEIIQTWCFDWI